MFRVSSRLTLSLLFVSALAAQPVPPIVEKLLADPALDQARRFIESNESRVIEYQVSLTEVPAPPFEESVRAEVYRKHFEERGLRDVRIDVEGNVIGVRPGRSDSPNVVLSAHLDTVFPAETDVKVRREGTVLHAPGIGDDGRGLAVLLGVIDALNHAGVETEGPITFVGTVGEEGLGDLRGVKHLFGEELKGEIDRFISVDGTALGVTSSGVGSYRYRTAFTGPGGHSYGAFGMPNPIHAMGRLIAKVSEFQTPSDPRTTFSVGRVFGGTSVNSIAFEAAFEIDMRSVDPVALEALNKKFLAAADEALAEEKARWDSSRPLELEVKRVGLRPAGETPADSPEVRAAVALTEAIDGPVTLRGGSTDANVGMSMGIPSITIGGGGRGRGAHSPGEWFDTADSWKGTERALLVVVAFASM